MQTATTIAKKGIRTLFLSLEMKDTSLINKIFAAECNIDSNLIRTGNITSEHIQQIVEKQTELVKIPLHISSKCRSIQQIEAIIRKLYNTKGLGLVVIDYLQLITNSKKFNNREQEVADISKTLKQLTLELNIPIIAVCQLSRNAQRQIPILSDLRESGAIEQDADNVIFLYCEDEQNNQDIVFTQEIMLKLAKQREGITGTIKVIFQKKINKFVNLSRKE